MRAGAAVGAVFDAQRAIVRLDDRSRNRQPQPAVGTKRFAGRTDRMKPFEDRLALIVRDARAVVADFQDDRAVCTRYGNDDHPAGGRERQRIVDQIVDHAFEPGGVAADDRRIGRAPYLHARPATCVATVAFCHRTLCQRGEIDRFESRAAELGIDPAGGPKQLYYYQQAAEFKPFPAKDEKGKKNKKAPTGTVLDNDLNFKFDLSYRDDITFNRPLDQDPVRTRGLRTLRIAPSIDYQINKSLNVRLFYDYSQTTPATSASFPITNAQGGMTIRFSLGR